MDDKSVESFSTSSSISSRKTSNFFPKGTSPILNNYSAPLTPLINHSSPGVNINQLNQALSNVSFSGGNSNSNGNVNGNHHGHGGNGNYHGYGSNVNHGNYGGQVSNGGIHTTSKVYGNSNQSTPVFNDFEFNEFKSPPIFPRRTSFNNDIWHKKPLDDYNFNFPLESTFETALELENELDKSVLELDDNLTNNGVILEELAPDQLPHNSMTDHSSVKSFQTRSQDETPCSTPIQTPLSNHYSQFNQPPSSNKHQGYTYGYNNHHQPAGQFNQSNYQFNYNYNHSPEDQPISVPSSQVNYYSQPSTQSSYQSFQSGTNSQTTQSSFYLHHNGVNSGNGNWSSSSHCSYGHNNGTNFMGNSASVGSNSGNYYIPPNYQPRTSTSSIQTTSSVHSLGGAMHGSIGSINESVSGSMNSTGNGFGDLSSSIHNLNLEDEVTLKLVNSKPICKPDLTIQKYNESFSSTFYKRNKNGYMYIKESNDDLIKLDDDFFKIDLKLGKNKKKMVINVNELINSEFMNDFKMIKRKPKEKMREC